MDDLPMRRKLPALVLCAILCGAAAVPAAAGVKVKTATRTYPVHGASGEDVIAQMNRYGPRHGFLTRAIAQTKYTVSWDIVWRQDGDKCRVARADATLAIGYTYPELGGQISPQLRRRWATFMAGVRRHEETHGRTAVRMVNAAQNVASRVVMDADPNCRKANAEVKRRVEAIYERYEAEQRAFDAREHRDGGRVEGLVESLARIR